MRLFSTFLIGLLAAVVLAGCHNEDELDGTQWIIVAEDGNTIRYLEFQNNQVRQYTHDLLEDCFDWEEPTQYTVRENTVAEGAAVLEGGELEISEGSIVVNGSGLSIMRFVKGEDTLTLFPVESEDGEVWDATDFQPREFSPDCSDLQTPTPTPTPSPTVVPLG